ncbi:MAG: CapA family protein [Clostridia bacterium]|nr:CapA family protein [Clostridia bacterium]
MRKLFATVTLILALTVSAFAAQAAVVKPKINSQSVSAIMKNTYVKKITLNATSVTIKNKYGKENTYQLKATLKPAQSLISDPSLTWSSSREHVATVSQDGLVTAVGKGSTLITVSADDQGGMVKATALVKVTTIAVQTFKLNSSLVYLDHTTDENTARVDYTVTPANATYQVPTWTSSDPSVASVDPNTGLITALSAGTTTITATVDGGNKSAKCEVKVRDKSSMKRITIGAVGDMVLGGAVSINGDKRFDNLLTNNGTTDPDYSYVFKNVKSLFDSFDLTIGNLEVALTNWKYPKNASSSFNFKGKPAYAKILVEGGIDVVTLENNHAYDFGGHGIVDTRTALRNNNVLCAYRDGNARVTVNGVSVEVISILSQNTRIASSIKKKVRTAKASSDVVILYLHSCEVAMYNNKIAASQITLSKAAIDAGADVVFCMHPAVLSGIGVYKGKYIYFDLGTFVGSGKKTCVDNMVVCQPLLIGSDQNGVYVECDIPTIYPGNSSGFNSTVGDIINNCQPVLYNALGTSYGRSRSDGVVAKIDKYSKALSWKYASKGVEVATYNVG